MLLDVLEYLQTPEAQAQLGGPNLNLTPTLLLPLPLPLTRRSWAARTRALTPSLPRALPLPVPLTRRSWAAGGRGQAAGRRAGRGSRRRGIRRRGRRCLLPSPHRISRDGIR